jgi:hypothetical protein
MGGLFARREWTVGSDTRVLQEPGRQECPAGRREPESLVAHELRAHRLKRHCDNGRSLGALVGGNLSPC